MRIAICAGELSSDILAADLIKSLNKFKNKFGYDFRFEGIAGDHMQALGCESFYPLERLSVHGIVDGLKSARELLPVRKQLIKRWLDNPPAVFIGVDAPDFNLPIARALHEHGIPTVQYVSPSVWAWRRYRIHKIRRSIDKMLVLFPFEKAFFANHGVGVEYVGHPRAQQALAIEDKVVLRKRLNLPVDATLFGLLPGSRASEVKRLSSVMAQTAAWIIRRRPANGGYNYQFVSPLVNESSRLIFKESWDKYASDIPLHIISGHGWETMAASDALLVASGTASLEAALLKKPMVVTYKLNHINWKIGQHVSYVEHVSLPNIILGEALVPEFLQSQATSNNLGASLLKVYEDKQVSAHLKNGYEQIISALNLPTGDLAAKYVLQSIDISNQQAKANAI